MGFHNEIGLGRQVFLGLDMRLRRLECQVRSGCVFIQARGFGSWPGMILSCVNHNL